VTDADVKTAASVDPAEVERFSRLAAEWWNPKGKFRPLHKFNPVRLAYVRDTMVRRLGRDPRALKPLEGLSLLDVGCGGGLLCEPMTRLGAKVTGIDPSATNIGVATTHAAQSGLAIDYRAVPAETLVEEGATFDVVLCMEVVEHVADVPGFLATVGALVKPGGLLLVATINRTPKAFALAIVGAEYVLGWLPKGTHQYDKLVRPEEIERPLTRAGFRVVETTGVAYNPLADVWAPSRDTDVNYQMLFEKSE
jgi:2-polyprenyl-6-hydroxyphenyl methylase / 3-demethylubiquinone-9 3-methyltransferase